MSDHIVGGPFHWQLVLEAFCESKDPMNWELNGLRLSLLQKHEAIMHLLENGWLRVAGRLRISDAFSENTYEVTDDGRYIHSTGITGLPRPKNLGKVRLRHADSTVAQRVHAISPVDVFDLARVPWTWDRSVEREQERADERRIAMAALLEQAVL